MQIELLDSTLREGAQTETISFSVEDKLSIAAALSKLGVKYIEAGNPVSNPKDAEFFRKAEGRDFGSSVICAFTSTKSRDTKPETDPALVSVISAGVPAAVVFGKTHPEHIKRILNVTPGENLEMIHDSVAFLHAHGIDVIFDAEHFFDAFEADEIYAAQCLEAASGAGARTLCLCDSNGGTDPEVIGRVTRLMVSEFPDNEIGIHAHNDSDCAVASTLEAVKAGAVHVQGCLNGYGERCGLARLSSVIANLELKKGIRCISGDIKDLTSVCLNIAETANTSLAKSTPYTGRSAFTHKAGMHIDAIEKMPGAFEHIDPSLVGNRRKMLLSEVSGKAAVEKKLQIMFPGYTDKNGCTAAITGRLKELENEGYQFEGADAGFYVLAARELGLYSSHFEALQYRTSGEFPSLPGSSSTAFVQIRVNGKEETGAAVGNGPVNALDGALRKALTVFYSDVKKMRLIDYKVRVLSPKNATGAVVRVLITSTDGENFWTTVGVSSDIIKASFTALSDSIEYYLNRRADSWA